MVSAASGGVEARPNFFLVGAPRSGTASMYVYLKQHPEIWASILKEPHFFGSDLAPLPYTVRDEALYLELFAGGENRRCRGEASVWYLSSTRAANEIRAFAPEARILVMLREPVEMARSLHALYCRSGNEDLPNFADALAAEEARKRGERIPAGAYFPMGLLYRESAMNAAKLERFLDVFGADRVLPILFDEFVGDTARLYARALEFLGVDPTFQAELDPRQAAERVRLQSFLQLRRAPAEIRRRLDLEGMKQHDGQARSELEPALAAQLREEFADDVARLGRLLGRDLSPWTRGKRLS